MAEVFGVCRFCGQSRVIRVSGEMEQEEADRLVSEACDCNGALMARSESEVMNRIDELFGPACSQKGFDTVQEPGGAVFAAKRCTGRAV